MRLEVLHSVGEQGNRLRYEHMRTRARVRGCASARAFSPKPQRKNEIKKEREKSRIKR